ncbi:hypothetical protein [Alteromonas macleodii]|uniref:hypothetical protein n=1 Tax=Alteromonas macleodii TaxID=28108 RepID=UPI000C75B04E|nr:hypothetical protein [Alteromonas macleodii]AUI84762.1 hypothetical protein TE101_20535 [Alteromonas macleodii]
MNINKYTTAIMAPSNRPFLVISVMIVCVVILGTLIVSFITADEKKSPNTMVQIAGGEQKADALADYDEAYADSIEKQNKANYENATKQRNGVHIPFIIDGNKKNQSIEVSEEIATCGCTMSDEEFHARLARAGVEFENNSDYVSRVGNSDIYISADRFLVGEDKQKHLLAGQSIRLGEDGALLMENEVSFSDKGGTALYLGVNGEIIDSEAKKVSLMGQLQSANGVVLMSNGLYAFRADNMTQIGNSDVYQTFDSQLVTLDGKPIRHAGNFVFRNRERELVDIREIASRWESSVIYQNTRGHLVNGSNEVFDKPGILFSYTGILIDNYGKLAEPLANLKRLGESDLLIDDRQILRDRFNNIILHYGDGVSRGIGDRLLTGHISVKNHKGAEVLVGDDGLLSVPIGSGGIQSGILKNSEGVAYDRNGHLITRQGKLTQKGSSDIFLTSDGLLATNQGKPLLFRAKDIFIDFNKYLPSGLIGLRTYDNQAVTDQKNNQLYLNDDGQFVNQSGELAVVGVDILTADNVVVSASGKLQSKDDALVPVVNADGELLLFNGKAVRKNKDGQLFDSDGNPILTQTGGLLRLNDAGFIVTEDGQIASMEGFSLKNGNNVEQGSFGTLEPLLSEDGLPLTFKGKKLYRKGNRVVDEDGNIVRDDSGSALVISKDGEVVNAFGVPITDVSSKSSPNSDAIELVTKKGESVYVNGKKVLKKPDGSLVYEDGGPVLDSEGRAVFMNEDGGFADATGSRVDLPFTDRQGRTVSSNEIIEQPIQRSSSLTSKGKDIFYKGKKVFRKKDGSLVDEDGNIVTTKDGKPVFANMDGSIVDAKGKPISENLFTDKDGRAVSNTSLDKVVPQGVMLTSDGQPLLFKGKKVFKQSDGSLVDEHGNLVKDSDGNIVFMDESGAFVDSSGNEIKERLFKNRAGETISPDDIDPPRMSVTANGEPLFYKGKRVFRKSNGLLVDEDGNEVRTEDGKSLRINSSGELVDEDGKQISEPLFTDAAGNIVENKTIDEPPLLKTPFTSDGKQIYFNGKKVFKQPDGSLIDENGLVVKSASGERVYVDNNGNLVNKAGKPIRNVHLTDKNGISLKPNEFKALDNELVTKNGSPILFNGKRVYKKKDGTLVDQDGNEILHNGRPVRLNESGDAVDYLGNKIEKKIFKDAAGNDLPNAGFKSEQVHGQLVTANGKPMLFNGEKVYRQPDGTLRTRSGKLVTDANGKVVYQSKTGALTDINGRKLANNVLTDMNGNSIANSSLDHPPLPQEVVTLNGSPLLHNGKKVFKRADGLLVDEDGVPIIDDSGNEVYLNEQMELVDSAGRKISSPFKKGRISTVPNGGFKALSSGEGTSIGRFNSTADGYLLDQKGRPMTYNGKKVRVGKDGMLIDEEGNPVKDSRGNLVYMSDSGALVDEKGEKLSGTLLADGDGVLLLADGKPVTTEMKRIGSTDFFVTRDGKIVDQHGRPFKVNGKAIGIDPKTGKLVDTEGLPIRDALGNSLFMTESGALVTSDKKPAKGVVVVDSDGSVVGEDGKTIKNAKDLIPIAGTDLYKTSTGLVVDKNGMPIKRDGELLYLDENNKIVDELGRSVRFRGQRLSVNSLGQVTGENGDEILINDKPVSLADLSTELAPKIEPKGEAGDILNVVPQKIENLKGKKEEASSTRTFDENVPEPKSAELTNEAVDDSGKIPTSRVDSSAKSRLAARLINKLNAMEKTTASYMDSIEPQYVSLSNYHSIDSTNGKVEKEEVHADVNKDSANADGGNIAINSGDTAYAIVQHMMDTDFNDELEVELHMADPDNPLHLAKAYAQVELRYDNAVLAFKRFCPVDIPCFTSNAIGLDPVTASAGLGVEVDTHFWYRFGGVFLASFAKGIGEGVENSQDRTEQTDIVAGSTESTTIISGLSTTDVLLQGVGAAGEVLIPTLAQRVNRPTTVRIPTNTEILVKFFEHIPASKLNKKP